MEAKKFNLIVQVTCPSCGAFTSPRVGDFTTHSYDYYGNDVVDIEGDCNCLNCGQYITFPVRRAW